MSATTDATFAPDELEQFLAEMTDGGSGGGSDGELHRKYGELFTAKELSEIETYAGRTLPIGLLPRTHSRGAAPLPYRRRASAFHTATHRWQTKLCAMELEAIMRALERFPNIKNVLYAGAAPGEHIVFLAEAFPGLEFHLVDPAAFRVQHWRKSFPGVEDRIHITRCSFTDELALQWKDRAADTLFFSDIRSGDHSQDEYDAEIEINMEMQRRWHNTAKFAASVLKLRFRGTKGAKYTYLAGTIVLQPCGPVTSAEGRLFVWGDAPVCEYDVSEYEDYFYWLNTIVREWASYDHGLDLDLVPGLCRCFDCARLVQIVREYAVLFPAGDSFSNGNHHIAYLIGRMVAATEQRLSSPPHGDFAGELPLLKREKLVGKYIGAAGDRRDLRPAARRAARPATRPAVQPATRPAARPATRPAPNAAAPNAAVPAVVRKLTVSMPAANSFRRSTNT